MNKDKIIQSLILGLSLMFSVGIISLVNVYAGQDDPGNNSGVYRPINEGPDPQTRTGNLDLSGGELTIISEDNPNEPRNITTSDGNMAVWGKIYGDQLNSPYYIDPNVDSFLNKVTFENRDGMSFNSWDGANTDNPNNIIPVSVSGRQVTIENGQMAVWGKIYGDQLNSPYYIDPNVDSFLNKVTFENRDGMSFNSWDGANTDNPNNIIPVSVSGRQVTIENGQMAVWGRIYGDTLGADYYIDPNYFSNIYSLGIAADLKVTGTTILSGTSILDQEITSNSSEKSIVNKKYVDTFATKNYLNNNFYNKEYINNIINTSVPQPSDIEITNSSVSTIDGDIVYFIKKAFSQSGGLIGDYFDSAYSVNPQNIDIPSLKNMIVSNTNCSNYFNYQRKSSDLDNGLRYSDGDVYGSVKIDTYNDMYKFDYDSLGGFTVYSSGTDDYDKDAAFDDAVNIYLNSTQSKLYPAKVNAATHACNEVRNAYRNRYGTDFNSNDYNDGNILSNLNNLDPVNGSSYTKILKPISTHICFLSYVEGKMAGGGEKAEVYVEGSNWMFRFNTLQESFKSSAICYKLRN